MPDPYGGRSRAGKRLDLRFKRRYTLPKGAIMSVCIVRMGIAVWLAGCCCHGDCQTAPSAAAPRQEPSDYSIYDAFFQKVALQKDAPNGQPSLLNGQPTDLHFLSIQEAVGLTDREMQALNGIATDCQAGIGALYRHNPHVVFDALMESIESGKDTSADMQQLSKDQENQRERMVLDHMQQVGAAFGDARFQELNARLRAEAASRPRTATLKR